MNELREDTELPERRQATLEEVKIVQASIGECSIGEVRTIGASWAYSALQRISELKSSLAEIERLTKNYQTLLDDAVEMREQLASLRASVGEKWIDVKQELPLIDEGSFISEIVMGFYGKSWDLVRLHRTKGWLTLPRWDKARNPIVSWHRLSAPPTLPGEEK